MKTPPAAFYNDPVRLPLEHEKVFARSWQLVGHVGQLLADAPVTNGLTT